MKLLLVFATLLWVNQGFIEAITPNLVCYYAAEGSQRQGLAQFSMTDLELAMQFCTHVIYGYVGIDEETFQLKSLNEKLDVQQRHFGAFTSLKDKYPHIKFLLSVGGDSQPDQTEAYIKLLEAGRAKQSNFIESSRDLLRRYNFDGLDLAFQLPRNKPRKVHGQAGKAWKNFKKFFTGDFVVDEKADEHRKQFTDLVFDLKNAFRPNELMLTLNVLPNVNSSWYYDAPALIGNLDFVTLGAFDFLTPQRNPQEADYASCLYEPNDQDRLAHYSVKSQVEHWVLQRVPKNKINIGIPAYGRAWKMTKESGTNGTPVVHNTAGPAPAGPQTKTEGFLNWAEICLMLPSSANAQGKGANAPLQRVWDPTRRYSTYAFRPADDNDQHGIWVSYDDPDSAANKAGYAKVQDLGVALFDLTQDDFRGQCTNDKFPVLRSIKYRLL